MISSPYYRSDTGLLLRRPVFAETDPMIPGHHTWGHTSDPGHGNPGPDIGSAVTSGGERRWREFYRHCDMALEYLSFLDTRNVEMVSNGREGGSCHLVIIVQVATDNNILSTKWTQSGESVKSIMSHFLSS